MSVTGRSILFVAASTSLTVSHARAQDTIYFPPTNRLVVRDMRAVPAEHVR